MGPNGLDVTWQRQLHSSRSRRDDGHGQRRGCRTAAQLRLRTKKCETRATRGDDRSRLTVCGGGSGTAQRNAARSHWSSAATLSSGMPSSSSTWSAITSAISPSSHFGDVPTYSSGPSSPAGDGRINVSPKNSDSWNDLTIRDFGRCGGPTRTSSARPSTCHEQEARHHLRRFDRHSRDAEPGDWRAGFLGRLSRRHADVPVRGDEAFAVHC